MGQGRRRALRSRQHRDRFPPVDQPNWLFYSAIISSARRLPNGNTLIDEGMDGRIFQVTRDGEIVWEYVNPHFGPTLLGNRTVSSNWVFRAQPVPYDWAPEGTPHSEKPAKTTDISVFRVSAGN